MPQAQGSQGRLAYTEESTWGTTPSNPTMQLLKAMSYGESLGGNIAEIISNSVNAARSVEAARGGRLDVAGSVPFELPVVGMGTLLKHALGSVTTGMDATQPANVTGVEILYAESGATSGDGTLAYTSSGTTLTWTAPSDTAGAGVDVSGGGDFTLESGSDGEALTVRVTAASLPGQDESDTLTVSSLYKHRMIRGALPAGLSLEKGFPDINQFIVFYGCKINGLNATFGNDGIVTGSLDVVGKGYALATSELGTPSEPTHTPFVYHEGAIDKDGSAAQVQTMALALTNALGTDNYVVGDRERVDLVEGRGEVTGSVTHLFKDQTHLNDWDQENEVTHTVEYQNGNQITRFKYPRVRFFGDALPKIETAQGVVQSMDYRALTANDNDNTDLVVEVINDQATI